MNVGVFQVNALLQYCTAVSVNSCTAEDISSRLNVSVCSCLFSFLSVFTESFYLTKFSLSSMKSDGLIRLCC